MSWRERELPHEGSAYQRALDQSTLGGGQAVMGGHVENGQSICDWFRFRGKKISMHYSRDRSGVFVEIEGAAGLRWIKNTTQLEVIEGARRIAESLL
jgi:hypothetical protein